MPAKKATKAERGTSIEFRAKVLFRQMVTEMLANDGTITSDTMTDAVKLYEEMPTIVIGLPLEVQLADVNTAIDNKYESKDITSPEAREALGALFVKQASLEKKIKAKEAKAKREAKEASAS